VVLSTPPDGQPAGPRCCLPPLLRRVTLGRPSSRCSTGPTPAGRLSGAPRPAPALSPEDPALVVALDLGATGQSCALAGTSSGTRASPYQGSGFGLVPSPWSGAHRRPGLLPAGGLHLGHAERFAGPVAASGNPKIAVDPQTRAHPFAGPPRESHAAATCVGPWPSRPPAGPSGGDSGRQAPRPGSLKRATDASHHRGMPSMRRSARALYVSCPPAAPASGRNRPGPARPPLGRLFRVPTRTRTRLESAITSGLPTSIVRSTWERREGTRSLLSTAC